MNASDLPLRRPVQVSPTRLPGAMTTGDGRGARQLSKRADARSPLGCPKTPSSYRPFSSAGPGPLRTYPGVRRRYQIIDLRTSSIAVGSLLVPSHGQNQSPDEIIGRDKGSATQDGR